MALLEHEKANFATLQRAHDNGDLFLLECTERATGKRVAVIIAIGRHNGEYILSPLARLFDGNPYDELDPPPHPNQPNPPPTLKGTAP